MSDERREVARRVTDAHQDVMAQNIAALAAVVEATAKNVHTLSDEVRELRKSIVPRKVIRHEAARLDHARRRALVAVTVFAAVLAWTGDEHLEQCGPGARIVPLIEEFAEGTTGAELREMVNSQPPPSKLCDVTFPLHDHDGNGWPHKFNALGLALWGGAFAGGVIWVTRGRPARRPDEDDPPA